MLGPGKDAVFPTVNVPVGQSIEDVAGSPQRSCWLLLRLQVEEDRPHRPGCRRCAAAWSRCWVLPRIAVDQAAVGLLPGVCRQAFGELLKP